MSHLMFIGFGDLGQRTADMLIRRDRISELTLIDLPNGGGAKNVEHVEILFKESRRVSS